MSEKEKQRLSKNSKNESSGSATGNPRNKVALRPGHSLMDWIRLGQSGTDLTGVGGVRQEVTVAQLAQHNTRDDAWIAIRGIVYNVTHYMDFHPGGSEELMRGVGTDATDLFNQVHAWVNYDSILKKCVVGRLKRGDSRNEDLRMHLFGSNKKKPPVPGFQNDMVNGKIPKAEMKTVASRPRMDWYQKLSSLCLIFYTKVQFPYVKVCLSGERELKVIIRIGMDVHLWHYNLSEDVEWPCSVTASKEKVDVQFQKRSEKMWPNIGIPCDDNEKTSKFQGEPEHDIMYIETVLPVTHNTKLFVLSYEKKIYTLFPLGHHIKLYAEIEGLQVSRCYTPVPPSLCPDEIPPQWQAHHICLMVKEYPNGQITPWLCGQAPGNTLEISGPEGSFDASRLSTVSHLYLLAAGTGVTPMLSLVKWGVDPSNSTCQQVNMMFFNCKERDILWRDQLDTLQKENNRFAVVNVLSEAEAGWTGERGRVDLELLQNFLPKTDSDSRSYYICVCGPTAFTRLTEQFLKEMHYADRNYHCFVG